MLLSSITLTYSILVVSILVISLKKSLRAKTIQESITVWFLFGFVTNLISSATYYVTLPVVSVSFLPAFFLISLAVFLFAAVCGLVYSIAGIASFYFKRNSLIELFGISLTFFFLEILRSYAITILLWGGGSSFGAHMSSWTFSEILANTPLVSFAYFGGVFALAGVLVFCVGIFVYPIKNFFRMGLFGIVILVSILIKNYPNSITDLKPVTIAVVQTSFSRTETGEDTKRVFRERKEIILPLVLSLASSSPDIIVFPEDSRFVTSQTPEEKKELQRLFPNTLFIDGTTRMTLEGRKNTSIIFDAETGETTTRNKGFLFPFGEYVPYVIQPVIHLFGGSKLLAAYESFHEYTAGVLPSARQTRLGKIGILICSEINSFTSIRSLGKTKPEIVFLQSSLAWGRNNTYLNMEYLFSVKIAAAMLRKPIITVANYGPSIVVDATGKTIFFKEKQLGATLFIFKDGVIDQIK